MGNENKNQKRKLAVFDIDGTLLDSGKKLEIDAISAFARLGRAVTTDDLRAHTWYELAAIHGITRDEFDASMDKRKSWEQSLRDGEAPLFDDAIPCLETLAKAGVALAVLTKSNVEYTDAKLKFHNLARYFGDRVAVAHVTSKSKDAEAIGLVKRIGPTFVSRAYFIGDRKEDVSVSEAVGREFGLDSEGIYLNRNDLAVPVEVAKYHQVKSLAEAPKIILGGEDGN